ncbi:MAG: endolytic transglycosylase MltG [Gemmatimonadaceae bacterium]|nr:endolytic transglycosylase MltG [Chitinophagaceae bacterium]
MDTNTFMTVVIPDTYTYYWNISPSKVFSKLFANYKEYWTEERVRKAKAQGLTPAQAYTLASIVEEETNATEEKGNIASVYLNRFNKGMNLGADPTVKYALRDFGLKRIYEKHLLVSSPYNTYRNRGLPPGPICTPSRSSIEAVLNAPTTEYFYFVAKRGSGGRHQFSKTYAEHLDYARQYHKGLDSVMQNKKAADEKSPR